MTTFAKRVALIESNPKAFDEISNIMERYLKMAMSLGVINSRWGQGVILKVNVCSRKHFGIDIFDFHSIDVITMEVPVIEFAEEFGKVSPMVGALVETIKGREEL